MLDVAARRIISGAVPRSVAANITLKQADAQSLPYPDACFNLATCAYGIRNIPNRELALAEAYRVLKPGGTLLICEFSTPPSALWRGLYNIWLGNAIPIIGAALTGDAREFCYLRDSIRAFPTQLAFCEMLFATGFANISYRNLTGGIVALHKATK
jgi:demethylmenaquinone methyltransferase/2-methoxy-6-polyprenyl-1,4-benzoquinol methylase